MRPCYGEEVSLRTAATIERVRGLSIQSAGLVFLVSVVSLSASTAAAQDFQLPPPEDELPVRLAGEVNLQVVFPFAQDSLCPAGAACILGSGAGIGGLLEWRFPRGLGVGVGYDAWFLDGNGVNELSTFQALRVTLRYKMLRNRQVHPYLGAAIGGLILGDTFRAEAVGGIVDLLLGVEIELGTTLAFTTGVLVRLLTTSAFRSNSDGVERAQGFGVDGAAALTVGLVLLQGNSPSN